jgi:hypothetical protein
MNIAILKLYDPRQKALHTSVKILRQTMQIIEQSFIKKAEDITPK